MVTLLEMNLQICGRVLNKNVPSVGHRQKVVVVDLLDDDRD